ncbi:hypothetical protein DPMN_048247 [Dreissena polymorpha]|uniref:Uncharacterized protein n=1 Tax=Dreissena polymorpha TaxID=45954 RepID=A0A9D4DB88_DREPO|nr:hypothetical protein DPMN_048247 [Dreissena polymorpha]
MNQLSAPHNILSDRVKGRVDPQTVMTGQGPLFTTEEEEKLVDHVKYMANLGYGFTITEVVTKATDYEVFLKKRPHDNSLKSSGFMVSDDVGLK